MEIKFTFIFVRGLLPHGQENPDDIVPRFAFLAACGRALKREPSDVVMSSGTTESCSLPRVMVEHLPRFPKEIIVP
jgi:hypothetical protein